MESDSSIQNAGSKPRRERAKNYTDEELCTLVEGVEKHRSVITSKFSDTITNTRKQKAWQQISKGVNSVSQVGRTELQVKKKWETWSSQVKGKESVRRREVRKTGGGDAPADLKGIEVKVIAILGETAIEGLSEGLDTSSTNDLRSKPPPCSHTSTTSSRPVIDVNPKLPRPTSPRRGPSITPQSTDCQDADSLDSQDDEPYTDEVEMETKIDSGPAHNNDLDECVPITPTSTYTRKKTTPTPNVNKSMSEDRENISCEMVKVEKEMLKVQKKKVKYLKRLYRVQKNILDLKRCKYATRPTAQPKEKTNSHTNYVVVDDADKENVLEFEVL